MVVNKETVINSMISDQYLELHSNTVKERKRDKERKKKKVVFQIYIVIIYIYTTFSLNLPFSTL